MSFVTPAATRSRCGPVLVGLFILALHSADALAQAGSRPALLFDSPSSFYSSIAGSMPVDVDRVEPLAPAGALRLPPTARYLLWAELSSGHLNVLEQMEPDSLVLRKRIPMSIGKRGIGKLQEGDKKTPVGVYRLTSHLSDAQLDDFYGLGAYPLNYPNPRDQQLGRTGHGIWLHGLPKHIGERPLLDSDGCIVVDNVSLLDLAENIVTGETWIVMSQDDIRWVAAASQSELRSSLDTALQSWKSAWEARDNARYLDFYAPDFSDLKRDRRAWAEYKTRVNDSKRHIRVDFSDMSMMLDPQQQDLVTVRYYQRYRSDNYNWAGWKEQVWRLAGENWQIIYEGDG